MDIKAITDNYVGIPYLVNGRDTQGLDCYGLVHLIYKNELGIELPSFVEDGIEANRTQELINQSKEGWEKTEAISAGDVIVFKVKGLDSHIAMAISSTHFIHARQGYSSAIESFSSRRWSTRFVGSYKYKPNISSVVMNAVPVNGIPHPLRTQRVTGVVPVGLAISEVKEWIIKEHNVPTGYDTHFNILVNGELVKQEIYEETKVQENDVIEFRVVPGDSAEAANDITRTIGTVAVIYAAAVIGSAAGAVAGAIGPGGAAVAAFAALAIGMAAVDAIAPIRPPRVPYTEQPGSSTRQLMVNGGANRPTPYGSIPFVLGKVRMTPPVGAGTYQLFNSDGSESYLRTLLVWGYGPIFVDETTLKIGELPLSNYEGITQITLDRRTEPTTEQLALFNGLYGQDKTQVSSGVELSADGVHGSAVVGPWLDAASTDGAVSDFTLSVHFPSGCRKVKSKGDNAGVSYASPVALEVEYKKISDVSWLSAGTFTVGATPVKDAFTFVKKVQYEANENVQVRIRRLTGTGQTTPDDPDYQWAFSSVLLHTTFSRNATPAIDPANCKIAKTAFEIKATDQLNGSIEGVNAIVQSYCKVWNGTAWVDGATSNPAALFRLVLEHPANPRRVTDVSNKIDLTQLQHWYEYCDTKGFEYNSVVGQQVSVLDILRDICAAGRASPTMIDGKWSVVIDEPKANVVQHFTAHNSWGFEGMKSLPKYPDGLRVTFYNEAKGYQEDEIIVYAPGKSQATAELLESISVPGVTKESSAIDHARWQMAQARLRPETYSLNADVEYIVCTRGDRVKVMHDVPMWGLASGRIKNIRTNLLSYSEQFSNAYWLHDSTSTIISDAITAPNSFLTADKLMETTTTAAHYRYKGIASASGSYTASVYLKQAERQWGYIQIATNTQVQRFTLIADLSNGAFVQTASNGTPIGTSYSITDAGNGWYRLSVTATHTSGNVLIVAGPSNSATPSMPTAALPQYVGDVTKGIYMWGAQLELSSVPTEYIQTTTAAVTAYDLDESVPMVAGTSYSIRVRAKEGASTIRSVVPKAVSGNYRSISLTTSATTAEIDNLDLFLFGENQRESQDCVVLAVEPLTNKSARLTLVDYGVTPDYDLFNDYLTYTDDVVFSSNMSVAPMNLIQSYGDKTPSITSVVSDETVMQRIADGVFAYNMKVSYSNAANLPTNVEAVEVQYDYADAVDSLGIRRVLEKFSSSSVTISGVEEGETLKVRIRYVGSDGRTGQWTPWLNHTIVGKTNPPSAVTGFIAVVQGAQVKLTWDANLEIDLLAYEVRTTDAGWGDNADVFRGLSTSCYALPAPAGTTSTWYIRAIDAGGNYSASSTSVSFAITAVDNTASVRSSFQDTSLTNASITLDWDNVVPAFGLSGYEVSYDAVTKFVNANTIVLPANWIGSRTFTVKTVDTFGNKSSGTQRVVTKLLPAVVTGVRAQVIDNNVLLYWTLPAVTTLPIEGVLIKKGATYETAVTVGTKSGEFTSLAELAQGAYTYWIVTVDTDNNHSTPTSVTCQVSKPPDFNFFGEQLSAFAGTKTSAVVENAKLLLPVNTTETFQSHFTSRGWTTPQNQIDAGYPIFIEPSNGSSSYQEVFDFTTTIPASQVTVEVGGLVIAGTPVINTTIETSIDNSTWSAVQTGFNIFATNFRYVRFTINVTETGGTSLYQISSINCRLDAKNKSDSGFVSAVSTDTSGTVVNFIEPFVDINSITLTPSGTSLATAVYDFNDAVIAGTYSVTSNVATIDVTAHGLVAGQKVSLNFTSGGAPSGTYVVTSVTNANRYLVSITTANTSGNVSTYPQGFRCYLFNSAGTRISGGVSWATRGY